MGIVLTATAARDWHCSVSIGRAYHIHRSRAFRLLRCRYRCCPQSLLDCQVHLGAFLPGDAEHQDEPAEPLATTVDALASLYSIVEWPQCTVISNARDQSVGGLRWAFGSVSCFESRARISTAKSLVIPRISVQKKFVRPAPRASGVSQPRFRSSSRTDKSTSPPPCTAFSTRTEASDDEDWTDPSGGAVPFWTGRGQYSATILAVSEWTTP